VVEFFFGELQLQKGGNLTPRPPLHEWRGGARDLVAGVERWRGIRDPGGVEPGMLSQPRAQCPSGTGCWVWFLGFGEPYAGVHGF